VSALHIACATEGDAYVAHTATMLQSLFAQHHEASVSVHFMPAPDVSRGRERLLTDMVRSAGAELSVLRVPDERLAGLPTKDFTRKATWYRIFLPELLPELDRILYLDSDLLILDSLDSLFATHLADNCLGAVTNVFQLNHLHRPSELGLAGPREYFNAGVLLMNLDQMRQEGATSALLAFAREHTPQIEWRDQDVLNVVLGDRRLPLQPRWNMMNSFRWEHAAEVFGAAELAEALSNPGIRHFEGPAENKPWHYLCDRSLRELYDEYRQRTPWPRIRRDGITPRNVIRRARRRRYSARGVR
jgi:lipopolysaccharide biosynthesis glycosyltransferase